MELALTYHVEAPRDRPSREVYDEIARQVTLAEAAGFDVAWFAEHHLHVHQGHLPQPLVFALWLAGRTSRIELGSAVICLNLYHPVAIAEQIAVADLLCGGRLSIGFGSGSTPTELALFGIETGDATERHARLEEALRVVTSFWKGDPFQFAGRYISVPRVVPCPVPDRDLSRAVWVAANSEGAAALAGRLGFKLMLSRERTIDEYRALAAAYRSARRHHGTGGRFATTNEKRNGAIGDELTEAGGPISTPPEGLSVSRAVYVAADDATAWREAAPALSLLWERVRRERPATFGATPFPSSIDEAAERLRFVVGSPETCVRQLHDLYAAVPFTSFNLQPRWAGLAPGLVERSILLFGSEVAPMLRGSRPDGAC